MPYTTDQYEGLLAETITIQGYKGDTIHAYMARPLGPGPFPGVVAIPHILGWTDYHKELAHRFAYHGFVVVVPDIWCRAGHGTPEDVVAKARAAGGLPDDQVVGDAAGAAHHIRSLPFSNGKVGIVGSCSSGRHTYLIACRTTATFDAAVDCWGSAIQTPDRLTPAQPVAPLDYTKDLSCPLLGIFGNEDQSPSPEQVNIMEQELKKYGKHYEFHRYDGAGHGFWYYHLPRPSYRQEQALDAWKKVWEFLDRHPAR